MPKKTWRNLSEWIVSGLIGEFEEEPESFSDDEIVESKKDSADLGIVEEDERPLTNILPDKNTLLDISNLSHLKEQEEISYYDRWRDAARSARFLMIRSREDYRRRRVDDPRLPPRPDKLYADVWVLNGEWDGFCGIHKTNIEVLSESPCSYSELDYHVHSDFLSNAEFFITEGNPFIYDEMDLYSLSYPYSTFDEFSLASRALGIQNSAEYKLFHRLDSRLVSDPYRFYKNWIGWDHSLKSGQEVRPSLFDEEFYVSDGDDHNLFDDYADEMDIDYEEGFSSHDEVPSLLSYSTISQKRKRVFYPSYHLARRSVREIRFLNEADYRRRYIIDPFLPPNPDIFYKSEWNGWDEFLKFEKEFPLFYSFRQASLKTFRLGIENCIEYWNRSEEDPFLPFVPHVIYREHWVSWYHFCSNGKGEYYFLYEDALAAARRLECSSSKAYNQLRLKDPKLPRYPSRIYPEKWRSLEIFTGTGRTKKFYPYQKAMQVVRARGIKNIDDYRIRQKEDTLLPSWPEAAYRDDWINLPHFFGTASDHEYKTKREASRAAILLGIEDEKHYIWMYSKDPRLPFAPYEVFRDEWNGWDDFLARKKFLKNRILTYKEAVKFLNVSSIFEFILLYADDPRFPKNLPEYYREEWEKNDAWYGFLGLEPDEEGYYSLYPSWEEASLVSQYLGFNKTQDYIDRYDEDPFLPSNPWTYYSEWKKKGGIYGFLGKPLPKRYKMCS